VLAICGDVAAKQITFVYTEVLANRMQNLKVRMAKRKTGHTKKLADMTSFLNLQ
jgi:hypothetical protein